MASEHQDIAEFFKDKKAMTISEVSLALEGYLHDMKQSKPDFEPNILVTKTIEYTKLFPLNKNKETVRTIRKYVIRND